MLVGDGKQENIRVSTICMRDGVRARPLLELGRMIVRMTTMSSWSYPSAGIGEVARVSVVEVEDEDGHDSSKSERGSTATLWYGHTSPALARSVLTQRPCPIIRFEVPVLKSEMSLIRVRRSGSKRCESRGLQCVGSISMSIQ